eukprot:scaffold234273_cov16-Prasinocladus_malaysianus.AAC.1
MLDEICVLALYDYVKLQGSYKYNMQGQCQNSLVMHCRTMLYCTEVFRHRVELSQLVISPAKTGDLSPNSCLSLAVMTVLITSPRGNNRGYDAGFHPGSFSGIF